MVVRDIAFIIVIILVTCLIMGGCVYSLYLLWSNNSDNDLNIKDTYVKDTYVSDIKDHSNNLDMKDVYAYTDPETGVCYLIYQGFQSGGITPRYNPDGSLMVKT